MESCPSTTINIISLLPQCLWPPNLAGWWLTMRGSPHIKSRGALIICYLECLLNLIVTWPNTWSRDKLKHHISTATIPMASKLGKVVINHKVLPLLKLLDPSITWFCKVTWHVNSLCLHSTCTMATKHGKMVTYRYGLSPINSHNPLNMFSREVAWQIGNIISPLSQFLWSQDLSAQWHNTRSLHS